MTIQYTLPPDPVGPCLKSGQNCFDAPSSTAFVEKVELVHLGADATACTTNPSDCQHTTRTEDIANDSLPTTLVHTPSSSNKMAWSGIRTFACEVRSNERGKEHFLVNGINGTNTALTHHLSTDDKYIGATVSCGQAVLNASYMNDKLDDATTAEGSKLYGVKRLTEQNTPGAMDIKDATNRAQYIFSLELA